MLRELTKRKKKPTHTDADFIEALGDVIRSATRLQSRLLRIATSREIVETTRDQKLKRDLLLGGGDLDLTRDLVDFDKALERVVQTRPGSFEKLEHPLLMLK